MTTGSLPMGIDPRTVRRARNWLLALTVVVTLGYLSVHFSLREPAGDGVPLELKPAPAATAARQRITVTVLRHGVQLNGTALDDESLRVVLQTGRRDGQRRPVTVAVPDELPYGRVLEVTRLLRGAGASVHVVRREQGEEVAP